jgi:putative endonuclease
MKQKQKTQKQIVGEHGENILVKHLVKQKYKIFDRNYRKKWGEIDVVARKGEVIHFFEVKSESVRSLSMFHMKHLTNPEENVHFWKRQRLARAVQTWLMENEKYVSRETDQAEPEWQVDVAAVFMDFDKRRARIRITENITLI